MTTSTPTTGPVTTVLHLAGSPVDDFFADLSRLYAADCLAAAQDPTRYVHHVAWVEPGGRWRFPSGLTRGEIDAAEPVDLGEALDRLRELAPDVALPQLFCLPGMTTYRALLDVVGIPYVGNTADVMALGAHKARAKAVVSAAGVCVPAGTVVRHGRGPGLRDLAMPVVVKPVDADNSVGVSLVHDRSQLAAAVDAAAGCEGLSGDVLVEKYVELGREVRCAVLDRGGKLLCLPLEEYGVDPDTKPIRDAADKLSGSGDDLALVAKDTEHAWIVDPDDPDVAAVHAAARACFRALGCRDYGLFDFRIDADGTPWFLEAGLYCSFAETSVVSVMARAAGIPLPALLATCLEGARARHAPATAPAPAPAPATAPAPAPATERSPALTRRSS